VGSPSASDAFWSLAGVIQVSGRVGMDRWPRAHGVRRAIKQATTMACAKARLPGCLDLSE
jgi:hypothetical protein